MGARLRNEWSWWAAALAGVAVMSWLTLQDFYWSDYDTEASAAFRALSAGDISGFLVQAPAYGGSLVLRAPFAAATAALGGGEIAVYRVVSIVCLLFGAGLAVALVRQMGERGGSRGARALVVALCVANPLTLRALQIGHPEELLCAAFAIGAVLAAIDRRTVPAAVLLGLAVATKSWAVLAIGPVLLALPARRLLALVIAGAVTLAVLAPILLAQAGESHTALIDGARLTGQIFNPQHVFWFLGDASHTVVGITGTVRPDGYRAAPEWLSPLTHPLIAFLVVPLSLAWWRAHRAMPGGGGDRVLVLLALLLLLRCALDPWNNVYYALPFLLVLLCWEARHRPQRPPVIALTLSAVVWFTFETAPRWFSPDMQCVVFLAWSLPVAAWLWREAFGSAAARARAAGEPAGGRPSHYTAAGPEPVTDAVSSVPPRSVWSTTQ